MNDPSGLLDQIYVPTGPSNTKGLEAESNVFIFRGLSLYLNGTLGAARYQQTGLWVANAPSDTEAAGLTWQEKNWNIGFFDKRIGKLYNDNGSLNQAIPIDPFSIANAYVNYTVKNASFLRGTKIALSVNNVLDNHAITGITPGAKGTAAAPYAVSPLDQLYLLPGRSVMISLTFGYAPRH